MGRPSGGSFVGLDIGSQFIKAVEVRGAGSSLTVTAMGIAETPPGLVQQGIIMDPKAIGAAVKSLLQRSGISAKKCVLAATGTASVVVRVIEVPRMTPGELRDTMKWEVERHIPFSAADVEMDYRALDDPALVGAGTPDSPNMEVLLAVVQRDTVNGYLATLEAAGLTAVAIDVEPLAAGRSLVSLNKTGLTAKNVMVVNIGASNTDVGIFRNQILRFPRSIPIAGEQFTSAISTSLGIGYDQAEEEKKTHAVILMDMIGGGAGPANPFDTTAAASPFDFDMSTPFDAPATTAPVATEVVAASPFDLPPGVTSENPFGTPTSSAPAATSDSTSMIPDDPRLRRRREIFDAILPTLGEFSLELRRSVDYFRSKYPNDSVDQILLCGGSAAIENLDQFIQTDLGIPTKVASPFDGLIVSSKQVSQEKLAETAPAFAVAVGLAARDAVLGSDK